MKRILISSLVGITTCTSSMGIAADYDYIDPGDYYYINRWDENEHVEVVRKLGSGKIKVRNLSTGETKVVFASKLLTKSELTSEETGHAIGAAAIGVGILFCLANPGSC